MPKRKEFPKRSIAHPNAGMRKWNGEIFKQEKAPVPQAAPSALKHRPAEPFGAGAVRGVLVLFWCQSMCKSRCVKVKSGVYGGVRAERREGWRKSTSAYGSMRKY